MPRRRIRDERIDATELLGQLVDHSIRALALEVRLTMSDPSAIALEFGDDLGQVRLVLVPRQPDVPPGARQRHRARTSNARVASGDDCDRHARRLPKPVPKRRNPAAAGFQFTYGSDGTRTRDLRRDRPAL